MHCARASQTSRSDAPEADVPALPLSSSPHPPTIIRRVRRIRGSHWFLRGQGFVARLGFGEFDLVDLFATRQPTIKAKLMQYKKGDQERGRETDRQTEDVNEGVEPVFFQTSERYPCIILKHIRRPSLFSGSHSIA